MRFVPEEKSKDQEATVASDDSVGNGAAMDRRPGSVNKAVGSGVVEVQVRLDRGEDRDSADREKSDLGGNGGLGPGNRQIDSIDYGLACAAAVAQGQQSSVELFG